MEESSWELGEPLQPLNLQELNTVGELVTAMSRCSFGARMLGETTATLRQWIRSGDLPVVVYDGLIDSPLGNLLAALVEQRWADRMESPRSLAESGKNGQRVLAVGGFSEQQAQTIFNVAGETIFINPFGLARPGQVGDGYYPHVVFSDPQYILPLMVKALEEYELDKATTVSQLIAEIGKYGGLATEVAAGAETFKTMVQDDTCTVILTISGAMTMAKMGMVVCDMIEKRMVDALCTTGALMAHGLVESVGLHHYKYRPETSDTVLAEHMLNRVTDTLEPESNLNEIVTIIEKVIRQYTEEIISPRILNHLIGQLLHERYPHERGILKSAYAKNVPVFVPAFHDSELGNDLYTINRLLKREQQSPLIMNQEVDTQYLLDLVNAAGRIGIFTIGGGVPRNYTQNVAALMELVNDRNAESLQVKNFYYGCRICPDPPYYGHLSGCTYSEGKSWRKMAEEGVFSEVHADATLVWPFLVKYVLEQS